MINNKLKLNLKHSLKNNNFDMCSNIIREEIINIFSEKILLINNTFHYTTLDNLKTNVHKFLSPYLSEIFMQFYFLIISETEPYLEFKELINIYAFLNNQTI